MGCRRGSLHPSKICTRNFDPHEVSKRRLWPGDAGDAGDPDVGIGGFDVDDLVFEGGTHFGPVGSEDSEGGLSQTTCQVGCACKKW